MEYITYKSYGMHDIYLISMKCIIYAQSMRPSLKCCCCTWYSRLGGLNTYHSVFFLGTGADFFQQLKLDFSRHFSEKGLFYNCY